MKSVFRKPLIHALRQIFWPHQSLPMAPSDERLRSLDHQKRLFGCFGNLLDDGPQEKRVWLGGRLGARGHQIKAPQTLEGFLLSISLPREYVRQPKVGSPPLEK